MVDELVNGAMPEVKCPNCGTDLLVDMPHTVRSATIFQPVHLEIYQGQDEEERVATYLADEDIEYHDSDGICCAVCGEYVEDMLDDYGFSFNWE